MSESGYALRKTAIHMLRSGKSPVEVAKELEWSRTWVYKWSKKFFETQDWQALRDQPQVPKCQPRKLPDVVRQAIRQTRSELEAEAVEPGKLSYEGAGAIRARLKKKWISPFPSLSSIERELRAAHLIRPYRTEAGVEESYPHLKPTKPLTDETRTAEMHP